MGLLGSLALRDLRDLLGMLGFLDPQDQMWVVAIEIPFTFLCVEYTFPWLSRVGEATRDCLVNQEAEVCVEIPVLLVCMENQGTRDLMGRLVFQDNLDCL